MGDIKNNQMPPIFACNIQSEERVKRYLEINPFGFDGSQKEENKRCDHTQLLRDEVNGFSKSHD